MLTYKEYEQSVFDWLLKKNKEEGFTFGLRQMANKGAEDDYFIGTQSSKYFSTTFWSIPINYPGSSGDLIQLQFKYTRPNNYLTYFFEFNQISDPSDTQNIGCLELIKYLKTPLLKKFELLSETKEGNKMYSYRLKPLQVDYTDVRTMLEDVNQQLSILISEVDKGILKVQESNTLFKAARISSEQFQSMLNRALRRIDAHSKRLDQESVQSSDSIASVPSNPLNQILYGPPGTGKTFNTINKAVSIINPKFDLTQERSVVKAEYQRLVENGQIVFTTFHQSMSYEDFVEGIKPVLEQEDENSQLGYAIEDGIFKSICESSSSTFNEMEEYNKFDDVWDKLLSLVRLKISKGELLKIGSWDYGLSSKDSLKYSSLNSPSQYTFTITKQNILDVYHDKQARPSGAFQKDMEDVLEFMRSRFKLGYYEEPSTRSTNRENFVLIIDEINRGNISAIFGELITLIEESKRAGNPEALKVTLPYSKRAFEVPSNLYIIGTMNTADRSVEALDTALRRRFVFEEMLPKYDLEGLQADVFGYPAADILRRINNRIEKLVDQDHTIGHAYFLDKNEEELMASFYKNIIPLLQEYFFGDYGKIGLVLGKGFIEKMDVEEDVFADFDYEEGYKEDLARRQMYRIVDHRKSDDPMSDFQGAISLLMH